MPQSMKSGQVQHMGSPDRDQKQVVEITTIIVHLDLAPEPAQIHELTQTILLLCYELAAGLVHTVILRFRGGLGFGISSGFEV